MPRASTSRRDLFKQVAACGLLPWVAAQGGPPGGMRRDSSAVPPENDSRWAELRSKFLFERNHAYFNNASLGSPPSTVIDAVSEGYSRLAANPTATRAGCYSLVESRVRPAVARLLGAHADEITLTRGASEGLHMIANGLDLSPGDEVVTTSQEHPGGLTPWLVRAERSGIVVRQVSIPSPFQEPGVPIEALEQALSPRTRVLFFCHVTRGGLLYPVRQLCSLARSRGIVSAVDGAQAVGTLQVNVLELGCDLYATSLHKWTLAPAGNGALYVRADMRPRFRSLFKTLDADRAAAGCYEMLGTYNFPVRAAVATALDFIESAGGVKAIEARNRALSDYLKRELSQVPGARLVTAPSRDVSSPAVTLFELAGRKAVDVERELLEKHRIHVDDHVRDGHDALRASTHFYNTRTEIDRLVEALRGLTRGV